MNSPAVIIPKPKMWFSSDLHHGHHKAMGHNARPWDKLKMMSEDLISIWNSYVKPEDRGFILGDFSFYDPVMTSYLLQQMKGQKTLIKGNHDHTADNVKVRGWNRILQYHEEFMRHKGGDLRICMFHFPILGWHQQADAAIHLHGHCHGNLRLPEELQQAPIFDVGVDAVFNLTGEYRPIELHEILDLLQHKVSVSLDHHKIRRKHFSAPPTEY